MKIIDSNNNDADAFFFFSSFVCYSYTIFNPEFRKAFKKIMGIGV